MTDYATLLHDHITLSCRSIDRLFLQAYVPKLQTVGQVCLFLNRQRGFRIPSSAAFGQIGEAYVTAIHRWAEAEGIPVRYFAKGENKAGIAYEALDNGFRWCADPPTLQRICNRLGATAVHTFFWRWFHRLPSPFTAGDLQAGYAYELAFRQFEISDTRVFDRPQTGRAFFEGVIRDHLDLGRPDQVVLVFDRKLLPRTPGRFQ